METRNFGNGDISLLGFGMMRLPLKAGGPEIDKGLAQRMVDAAVEAGVNYFDTAWIYHGGESETFTGAALSRHKRESYRLATKLPMMAIGEKSELEPIFSAQLKKLKTNFFDYYLVHGITKDNLKKVEEVEAYEFLAKKKERGLIGQLGFSFHDRPEILQTVADSRPWDFAQIQLNFLDWEIQEAKTLYQILFDRKIPVIVMEPVRGGMLAALGEEAGGILKECDPSASPASFALRFAASLPGVQVVLSGMSNMEQTLDNIKTFSPFRPLTDAERAAIDSALTAYKKTLSVPCTSCRYCMDCPEGVDIPTNLQVYNNFVLLKEKLPPEILKFVVKTECELIKPENQAAACVACGECVKLCPQKIDIPHWLDELSSSLKAWG
jgi:predicted aldo/keto reductase-like oxidoreductase